jgi:hypothetical protein
MFGISDLDQWTGGRLTPSASGFGRIIRFLSHIYDPQKGVLGLDVGASSSVLAIALRGKLHMQVFPQLGLGTQLGGLLEHTSLENITLWLPYDISEGMVRDYIYNKMAYPASIPVTEQEIAIEQALARQIIRNALHQTLTKLPFSLKRAGPGFLPWVEPILATGDVLTHAPTPGQSLLTLLDGLQPAGVTTIVLDKNSLMAPLGASAEVNPLLVIQILESNAFLNLGTVIAPAGRARLGSPVLRVRVTNNDGSEANIEVKYGSIEVIPVPLGQPVQLHLRPLQRFNVGMGGPGRTGRVRVTGGLLGIVIDARGRPLHLSSDPGRRRELLKRWLWALEK